MKITAVKETSNSRYVEFPVLRLKGKAFEEALSKFKAILDWYTGFTMICALILFLLFLALPFGGITSYVAPSFGLRALRILEISLLLGGLIFAFLKLKPNPIFLLPPKLKAFCREIDGIVLTDGYRYLLCKIIGGSVKWFVLEKFENNDFVKLVDDKLLVDKTLLTKLWSTCENDLIELANEAKETISKHIAETELQKNLENFKKLRRS